MPKRVLVIGSSGGVGQHVVHKLLERDVIVHLMARDTSRARELFGDRPTLLSGDVTRPETLEAVFTAVDGVICTVGSRGLQAGSSPESVDFAGVQNLVAAAVSAKATAKAVLEHFVLVSSIAVTHPEHPLNQYGRILDWKLKGEEALRSSGLAYTIVRPGGLTNELGGQHALLFDQGDRISGMISRADVAEVCIQALDHPRADNVTFEVIEAPGPAPLDFSEMFARLKPDPVLR